MHQHRQLQTWQSLYWMITYVKANLNLNEVPNSLFKPTLTEVKRLKSELSPFVIWSLDENPSDGQVEGALDINV